ncbi:MAG: glucokinase [Asticcacaulis sp.]|nr:glucokinase [Asticcacaulis sp.]
MTEQVLLCDLSLAPRVGLALATPGRRPDATTRFTCPDTDTFDDEVRRFLGERQDPALIGAAMSARGWEQNNELYLVGVDFRLDRDHVRSLLGVQRVNFVNNFVARALAVPQLRAHEKVHICGNDNPQEHVLAVLGPHHGLGLAGLASDGMGGWMALHGEGGHSDMPIKGEREWRLIEAIRQKTGYVSRESCISVNGLIDIWDALHAIAGEPAKAATPADIIAAARDGNPRAIETIDAMTTWLGAMSSDVALIMGASGIYLTGALLDMIGDLFNTELFAARYLDKGPLSNYAANIPVFRTQAADMEISGLATLYD